MISSVYYVARDLVAFNTRRSDATHDAEPAETQGKLEHCCTLHGAQSDGTDSRRVNCAMHVGSRATSSRLPALIPKATAERKTQMMNGCCFGEHRKVLAADWRWQLQSLKGSPMTSEIRLVPRFRSPDRKLSLPNVP